ncbi:MAG: glycosyltransferase [Xenococcaceae cyanobacterium MO_188.B29]|nr:glycosyltransferase [Xenococcaceae cyanobacterium MO_188.B29]
MTKILYITTGLSTGGAEMMLYNLLAKLDRRQFEPIVISLMDKDRFGEAIEKLNIPVYTLGMNTGIPTIQTTKKLIQTVNKLKPDLIQGWMYHGNIAAQFVSSLSQQKIPVLWSIHHSLHSLSSEKLLTQALIKLGGLTAKFVKQVAFVSEKSKLQHENLGYPAQNSCIIPNGFDTSLFKPSTPIRKQFRQELGLPSDALLIGSIARYHPMKDHDNLLRSAKILLSNYPEAYFILVGTDVDKENTTLTNLIAELDISDRVYLLGERRDIPQITPALDILTSSSAFGEAFPLVIGEAMACAIPCVATDLGDSAWIIGDTGKVVPIKNPQALATAWQELISLSTEDRKTLGETARSRIISYFSLDSVVAQYESLYQQAILQ